LVCLAPNSGLLGALGLVYDASTSTTSGEDLGLAGLFGGALGLAPNSGLLGALGIVDDGLFMYVCTDYKIDHVSMIYIYI
jgi:hypothetical protein